MTASMDLEEILIECLSLNALCRKNATEHIASISLNVDYPKKLASIISNSTNSAGRAMAAVSLKNCIDPLWCSLTTQDRTFIRSSVTKLLGDANVSIQSNIVDQFNKALILSRVAHIEYPDAWPLFFEELAELLRSDNTRTITGSMMVLSEFVREDLSDLSFPTATSTLMPVLYNLFLDTKIPSVIRSMSINIICEFIDIMYMIKEDKPQVITQYLEPLLALWHEGLVALLREQVTELNMSIKQHVLELILKLFRSFPKQVSSIILPMTENIFEQLLQLQILYQIRFINKMSLESIITDVSLLEISAMITYSIEFIQLVCRKKEVKPIFTNAVKDIIGVLFTFLQITNNMERDWRENMDMFIEDDDEDSQNQSVRLSANQCLDVIIDQFPSATMSLFEIAQAHFAIANENRLAGSPDWWKINEVCLLVLSRYIDEFEASSNTLSIMLNNSLLFDCILPDNMNCNEFPFLQGRVLCFSSLLAGQLSTELVQRYVDHTVQGLACVEYPAQILAVKAIHGFLSKLPAKELASNQNTIIQGLLNLAENKLNCIILMLETLGMAIKLDKSIPAQYEARISNVLLKAWSENCHDVFVMELISELFVLLAANPLIANAFQSRMFPILLENLDQKTIEFNPVLAATSLDLLICLIKNVLDPLPPIYTARVFPIVIDMVMQVDDSGLLQNAQELLKAIVERDFSGLLEFRRDGIPGIELLLNSIVHMLSIESESGIIFLGSLITRLIQIGGQYLVPYLPQLLTAVIFRLNTAKMPAFIETLVLIFCSLIENQTQVVIEFLAGIQLQTYTGLELFVRSFCDCFADFQGVYTVKLGTLAMILLFSSNDPRLRNIAVKGDLIENSTNKIVTRSISKVTPDEYAILAFPIKAVRLLLHEYQSQCESRMRDSNLEIEDERFDSDEYETASENSEGLYSSLCEYDNEDDRDDALKDTLVYRLDLKLEIENCFKRAYATDVQRFHDLCLQLNPTQQNLIHSLIQ